MAYPLSFPEKPTTIHGPLGTKFTYLWSHTPFGGQSINRIPAYNKHMQVLAIAVYQAAQKQPLRGRLVQEWGYFFLRRNRFDADRGSGDHITILEGTGEEREEVRWAVEEARGLHAEGMRVEVAEEKQVQPEKKEPERPKESRTKNKKLNQDENIVVPAVDAPEEEPPTKKPKAKHDGQMTIPGVDAPDEDEDEDEDAPGEDEDDAPGEDEDDAPEDGAPPSSQPRQPRRRGRPPNANRVTYPGCNNRRGRPKKFDPAKESKESRKRWENYEVWGSGMKGLKRQAEQAAEGGTEPPKKKARTTQAGPSSTAGVHTSPAQQHELTMAPRAAQQTSPARQVLPDRQPDITQPNIKQPEVTLPSSDQQELPDQQPNITQPTIRRPNFTDPSALPPPPPRPAPAPVVYTHGTNHPLDAEPPWPPFIPDPRPPFITGPNHRPTPAQFVHTAGPNHPLWNTPFHQRLDQTPLPPGEVHPDNYIFQPPPPYNAHHYHQLEPPSAAMDMSGFTSWVDDLLAPRRETPDLTEADFGIEDTRREMEGVEERGNGGVEREEERGHAEERESAEEIDTGDWADWWAEGWDEVIKWEF